ncbi:hypothetical protein [Flagellimonas eckloniae]|uniref:Uncharacterized protein n=1 Tax=Flagellimonas eckloniae TaxID=346185 RepID=A0A0Q0XJI3_9FLAO|nr:hypothetical protein [Allomuricauda eckloniae]KQC31073.1 hypothetical protein AAY42_15090 [Allomuricauda eckloniae]
MKIRLILITITLVCCKTQKTVVEDTISKPFEVRCILKDLRKTTNYKNEITKYTSIYRDTIIELESVKTDSTEYKTMLDLQKSERFLWILAIRDNEIDSLLIDCVSKTKWVESNFLLDQCEIEMAITAYDNQGMAISGGTQKIKYKN